MATGSRQRPRSLTTLDGSAPGGGLAVAWRDGSLWARPFRRELDITSLIICTKYDINQTERRRRAKQRAKGINRGTKSLHGHFRAERLISDSRPREEDEENIAPFEEEDKAIVWAVCLLLWCCVCLVVVQQRRDADEGQSSRARPVCMLYSFINYTDFKAALFYNAGLL